MLIQLKDINISIDKKKILQHINFEIKEGEFVYVIGKVGSGKSSLLKALYADIQLSGEKANVLDINLKNIKTSQAQALRRNIGIVFQDFALLTHQTITQNLDFVLRATGWKKRKERSERINEVLLQVEMNQKSNHYPYELSGGEQQRVAIARALLNRPKLILADEPTGNLDIETSRKIVQLLHSFTQNGTSIVMVTHNLQFLTQFPGRVYQCANGSISDNFTEKFI